MLAQARGDTLSLHPELTIEPIYKPSEQDGQQEFDQSKAGRRLSTYIDSEGKLQIKTVCESPEIRNLSERDSEEGLGSDSDHPEDGKKSFFFIFSSEKILITLQSPNFPASTLHLGVSVTSSFIKTHLSDDFQRSLSFLFSFVDLFIHFSKTIFQAVC